MGKTGPGSLRSSVCGFVLGFKCVWVGGLCSMNECLARGFGWTGLLFDFDAVDRRGRRVALGVPRNLRNDTINWLISGELIDLL